MCHVKFDVRILKNGRSVVFIFHDHSACSETKETSAQNSWGLDGRSRVCLRGSELYGRIRHELQTSRSIVSKHRGQRIRKQNIPTQNRNDGHSSWNGDSSRTSFNFLLMGIVLHG